LNLVENFFHGPIEFEITRVNCIYRSLWLTDYPFHDRVH
jgi:hypothetical protein